MSEKSDLKDFITTLMLLISFILMLVGGVAAIPFVFHILH